MALREDQKQELVSIFKVEPRSVQDIANIIGVHYVTAQRWIKELERAQIVRKMPFLRGKEKVYCLNMQEADSGALLVQSTGNLFPVAEFAIVRPGKQDPMQLAGSFLAFLYNNSYQKEAGGWRGSWTPVQIREWLRRCRSVLIEEVQVLEQILLLEDIFQDSEKVYKLMGEHPDMANLREHLQMAEDKYKELYTSGGKS